MCIAARGNIVLGHTGWQSHALSDGSGLQKVDPTRAPIQHLLWTLLPINAVLGGGTILDNVKSAAGRRSIRLYAG
jgi:NADPH-dependent curcumin reductase CurA